MKRCSKCKTEKQHEQFHKNKNSPDGVHYWCKTCTNGAAKKLYDRPEVRIRMRKAAKAHYIRTKDRQHEFRRARYKIKVLEMFDLLGHKCARCGNTDKRVLQFDHVNGGGRKHRSHIDGSWWRFAKDVLRDGKLEFQVLCANCNWIEGIEKGYRKSIW